MHEDNSPSEHGDANKKPRKEKKMQPMKQSTSVTAPKRKHITKAEGDQAMAQFEDQGQWSDDDTRLLLETLLGNDSELYDKLMTNAKYAYKKVVDGNG